MTSYLFVYHGGKQPETQDDIDRVMKAWNDWFFDMGSAVVDGGAPVGISSTVNADGSVTDNGGANPAGGYSIIAADNLADIHAMARGCPILIDGGSIEIAEIMQM